MIELPDLADRHRSTMLQDVSPAAARDQLVRIVICLVSLLISAAVNLLESLYAVDPVPYHTSALSGAAWVMELLAGHPERIRCELGLHKHVFLELIQELRRSGHSDSRFVSLEEQLAIFLYMSVTGLTIRHTGERFQRSNETISRCVCSFLSMVYRTELAVRYFRKMTDIFATPPFYTSYVQLPTADEIVSMHIRHNPKFFPYFKDALGALDGSHISSAPPAIDRAACRNRKGYVSQNCLFACDFTLKFVYSLTGWEGSATDARVFQAAQEADLVIPHGKYYLADAGYPRCPQLLTPYRGVRYHLAEWARGRRRYVGSNSDIPSLISMTLTGLKLPKNCLIFVMHHSEMPSSVYLVF
jgi:hypothetical protein